MDPKSSRKKRSRKEFERSHKKEQKTPLVERSDEEEPQQSMEESEEEALEENVIEESEEEEKEEESGEDLMEGMERDYARIPELDVYEKSKADEEEYSKISDSARRAAEKELEERDREKLLREGRSVIRGRVPTAIIREIEELSEEDELAREVRAERQRREMLPMGDEDEKDDDRYLDIEEIKGKHLQWIRQKATIRWIKKSFNNFLRNFRDNNSALVYEQRITDLCTNNRKSLEVTYTHLSQKNPTLALWMAEYPAEIIPLCNEVAYELVTELFPEYDKVTEEIFVRIKDLPLTDNLRDLRQTHINNLVKIKGVVTKRTTVFPQLKRMYFICAKCSDRKGPIFHSNAEEVKLGGCAVCQSKGPFILDTDDTVYRNFQKITIQETPGTVPAGRVPRQKDVILLDDNVDIVRPGDEAEITGIFTNRFEFGLNIKHGFPVFSTVIEANYVRRLGDLEVSELTEEDKMEIRKLSKQSNIGARIMNSIAPSIFGHEFVKKAIALAMFGGVGKDIQGKHRIRGDINVLVLGDPGTAKSQFLKYVSQTFDRCVYTTGKGASAVGLTAGVRKDPVTREWTLEGGALVLADKGICCIDEFDKMNDTDRTSIHEAMEQQTISISKAGIVTSLQARCSVIAAANPLKGRYDSQLNFNENVDLTEPILSRFDVMAVIKDEIESYNDEALASFVINSHIKSHPDMKHSEMNSVMLDEPKKIDRDIIDQELLKKYIKYARKHVNPKLTDVDKEKIGKFYSEIRKESSRVGGLMISVRHIESLLRMAEAHAKMHLREYVRIDDVDASIKMLLESFLCSQKYSVSRALRKKFQAYITHKEDKNQLLFHILERMMSEKQQYIQFVKNAVDVKEVTVSREALENEARDFNIHEINNFFKSSQFLSRFKVSRDKKQIVQK